MDRLEISIADLLAVLGQPSDVLQAGTHGVLRLEDGTEVTDPAVAAAQYAGTPVQSYTYEGSHGEPVAVDSYIILRVHT